MKHSVPDDRVSDTDVSLSSMAALIPLIQSEGTFIGNPHPLQAVTHLVHYVFTQQNRNQP